MLSIELEDDYENGEALEGFTGILFVNRFEGLSETLFKFKLDGLFAA